MIFIYIWLTTICEIHGHSLHFQQMKMVSTFLMTIDVFKKSPGPKRRGERLAPSLIFQGQALTPLKFNMEPENRPPEKEIPVGNHHFQVPC